MAMTKKRSTKSKAAAGRKKTTSTARKKATSTARKKATTSTHKKGKASTKRKYGKSAQTEVKNEMHRYKKGTAKSGRAKTPVKSRKQAIAIALSKARKKGGKVPKKSTKK